MSDSEDFERGLRIRREVLGDEFVDANLAGSDAFMMTFQHLVTELACIRLTDQALSRSRPGPILPGR